MSAHVQGFDELDRFFALLPKRAAVDLQATIARQLIDAKREIVRSSDMSPSAKRALRARDGIVRIIPRSRRTPRDFDDIVGSIYSTWQGAGVPTKAEAVAVAIEQEIGKREYRPVRRKRLLIPAGDFRTKSGRVRRRGGAKVDISKLPDTRIVPTGNGRLLLVQTIKGGGRADFENVRGTTKRGRGDRERIVGVLVRRARITTRLDFFGGWARLAPKRSRDYGALLDRLLRSG